MKPGPMIWGHRRITIKKGQVIGCLDAWGIRQRFDTGCPCGEMQEPLSRQRAGDGGTCFTLALQIIVPWANTRTTGSTTGSIR